MLQYFNQIALLLTCNMGEVKIKFKKNGSNYYFFKSIDGARRDLSIDSKK